MDNIIATPEVAIGEQPIFRGAAIDVVNPFTGFFELLLCHGKQFGNPITFDRLIDFNDAILGKAGDFLFGEFALCHSGFPVISKSIMRVQH
jgi:hypothetical protein